MENLNTEDTTYESTKPNDHEGPDFSYAFDNPLIGARTYQKDGETIYEIEIPLSMDEYMEVSQEQYDKHINYRKDIRAEQLKEQQKRYAKMKQLNEMGYTPIGYNGALSGYGEQLLKTMKQKGIDQIKEIPQYLETAKDTQIQLFQSLGKREKTPDFYESTIIGYLEKFEEEILKREIKNEEFHKLEVFFEGGYIQNVDLFYRFEELKKNNIIYHIKRLYTYGSKDIYTRNKYGKQKSQGYNETEIDYIQSNDLELILHYVSTKKISIGDLNISEGELIEKAKRGYIRAYKEVLWGKEGISMGGLQWANRHLKWLNRQESEIEERRTIAKAEFLEEFGAEIVDKIQDTKNINYGIITNIYNNMMTYEQAGKADSETKKQEVIEALKASIACFIQKIKNKEKRGNVDWEDRRALSYQKQIESLGGMVFGLDKQLQLLSGESDRDWAENKDKYIAEYKTFFKDTFIKKRTSEIYKGDINDTEKLQTQIIGDVKTEIYKQIQIRGARRHGTHQEEYLLSAKHANHDNRKILNMVKDAFFQTGHSLLLTTLYPDNRERKEIRRDYVQKVTEQILEEIYVQLSQEETFSNIHYHLIGPIYTTYQRYGGTKPLLNRDMNQINQIAEHRIKSDFTGTGYEIIKKMESELEKATVDAKLYEPIWQFKLHVQRYISYFLDKKGIKTETPMFQRDTIEIRSKNLKRDTFASTSCIDDISSLGIELDTLEKALDEDILKGMLEMYTLFEEQRNKVISKIIEHRFLRNAQAGGKIQRMTTDYLMETFGTVTMSRDQITSILKYLETNLPDIIIQDLSGSIEEIILLQRDKDTIKNYISEYIKIFGNPNMLGSQEPQSIE